MMEIGNRNGPVWREKKRLDADVTEDIRALQVQD